MSELSKDLIGKKMGNFTITVERGKIREFCQAIGEKNPLYLDREKAKAAGFRDTPIPPTFQTSFLFWGWGFDKFWEDLDNLGLDTDRLLHMKEEYDYIRPIYPGDVITGNCEIVAVKTGKMDIMTLKTIFTNEKNEPCLEARMTVLIRPEGK